MTTICLMYKFKCIYRKGDVIGVARLCEEETAESMLETWPNEYIANNPECTSMESCSLVRFVDETEK